MPGYRIPGPLCVDAQPWDLADGTIQPAVGVAPGTLCSTSPVFRGAAPFLPQAAADSSILFTACLNPTRGLSDADYGRAAAALGAEIAAVQAVADVETSGNAFDDHGRPRILFERHYFHRLTAGRFGATHAAISDATAGGYGKFSEQYGKLEEAYGLDADAALRSASWGRFQIMGDNCKAAGFASVREFVIALTQSEAAHLDAFVAFVGSDRGMAEALRTKDWASFARRYNGSGYAKNDYDNKIKQSYDRFAAQAAPTPAVTRAARGVLGSAKP
ncbi:MAG: N-acetylmuramidase family protein [Rhizobacter sp.]|nr:N-acetylmuramidase family protein [Rhizobacter sp.]